MILHFIIGMFGIACDRNSNTTITITITITITMNHTSGLSTDEAGVSSLKMIPTYVFHLPVGRESGKYLAIDLGGRYSIHTYTHAFTHACILYSFIYD